MKDAANCDTRSDVRNSVNFERTAPCGFSRKVCLARRLVLLIPHKLRFVGTVRVPLVVKGGGMLGMFGFSRVSLSSVIVRNRIVEAFVLNLNDCGVISPFLLDPSSDWVTR